MDEGCFETHQPIHSEVQRVIALAWMRPKQLLPVDPRGPLERRYTPRGTGPRQPLEQELQTCRAQASYRRRRGWATPPGEPLALLALLVLHLPLAGDQRLAGRTE
jgi:hypothetical protein